MSPTISFEFFPPRSVEASFRLWDTIQTLSPLAPEFVSVTYGAGGTTRQLTHEAVTALTKTTDLRVAAHLTCVDATRDDTMKIAKDYIEAGVTDIVALRGDAPKGQSFAACKDGFSSSLELISALKSETGATIRVGAYPDSHPDADSMQANIDYLKAKFDAGADAAITQFFFESETFFRFRDACAAAGIDQPILPGIFPIENWTRARNFAARCGTHVPAWLNDAFEKAIRDDRHDLLAASVVSELCTELVEGGVDHLHFYTLNRPELTRDLCASLGITPKQELARVA